MATDIEPNESKFSVNTCTFFPVERLGTSGHVSQIFCQPKSRVKKTDNVLVQNETVEVQLLQ
jgi:hypothetical protein